MTGDSEKGNNLVRYKSYEFALQVVELYRLLLKSNEYVLSKQLLKSGTSIGANVEEAIAGQSRADFLSKMSIASKEARESNYWLRLICDSNMVSVENVRPCLKASEDLIRLLTSIVKTTANKSNV